MPYPGVHAPSPSEARRKRSVTQRLPAPASTARTPLRTQHTRTQHTIHLSLNPMTHKRTSRWLGGLALTLASAGLPGKGWGQEEPRSDSGPDSIQLIPNARYRAGWLQRALLGAHYRQLWTTRVTVGVLNLDRDGGGLTPICRPTSFETPSLAFRGADGRRYVFRSVDRDPTPQLLPRALHRSFVAYALQDQMSARHPAGAVVVAPLVSAVRKGAHPAPKLRVIPDDSRLGSWRGQFAGMLGTIEEQPLDDIESTAFVWAAIGQSDHQRVNARAYLKSRLIDILVGDWERQYDRWTWTSVDTAG